MEPAQSPIITLGLTALGAFASLGILIEYILYLRRRAKGQRRRA